MQHDETITGPAMPPADASGRGYADQTLVASRYRVTRLLGRGGMGEVYEVDDLELGVHVALKTIRAEIAETAGMLERFKREIQLARQITHPNVCRLFDLGRDRDGTSFITMELLPGETLAARLGRGPLTVTTATPLVTQLLAGLGAAHAAGVVHRDLKPANVILVGDRVTITDFGLARSVDDAGSDITSPAQLVGTPAYMAPEQVSGGAITAATDVYALGVVMFEMVTGRRPFEGDSSLKVATARLTTPPPSPRSHVPDLDPAFGALILRCLTLEPERRPTCAELRELLAPASPAPRRWPVMLGAALVAGGAVAAALAWPRTPPPPPSGHARTVAVLGFADAAPRPERAWISTALGEMLTSQLAASPSLVAVPGELVAKARAGAGAGALDGDGPERLRRDLGADVIVYGSLRGAGDELHLDVRVSDGAGHLVGSFTEDGRASELIALAAHGGGELRRLLAVSGQPGAGALPTTVAGAQAYAEGVDRLRAYDLLGARARLREATAADPDYALAHSALAEALGLLGYDEQARDSSARAVARAGGLGLQERLLIECRHHDLAVAREKAAECYRRLWAEQPERLEPGLALVRIQGFGGQTDELEKTLAALRELPAGNDARIDLAEGFAAGILNDNPRRKAAAARAARIAVARGDVAALAYARTLTGWADFFSGDPAGAMRAFADGRVLAASIGERSAESSMLLGAGLVDFQLGRVAEARPLLEACVEIRRALGGHQDLAEALGQLSFVYAELGELDLSLRVVEENLGESLEVGDAYTQIFARFQQGLVLFLLGDLGAAKRRLLEGRALAASHKAPSGEGYIAGIQGQIAAAEGDLPAARARYDEAIALLRAEGNVYLPYSLHALGHLLAQGGAFDEAQRLHDEGRSQRVAYGMVRLLPESDAAASELAWMRGDLAAAETLGRAAADGLLGFGMKVKGAIAQAQLARVLVRRGKLAEARDLITRAAASEAYARTPCVSLPVELARAELHLASRAFAQAGAVLRRTVDEAERVGLIELALQARLALGRAELGQGRAADGRRRLAELVREADERGYVWLSRQATSAR